MQETDASSFLLRKRDRKQTLNKNSRDFSRKNNFIFQEDITMTMIIQIVTAIALILSIILPVSYFFLGEKNKKTL
mgnify:CR=1 FL=1